MQTPSDKALVRAWFKRRARAEVFNPNEAKPRIIRRDATPAAREARETATGKAWDIMRANDIIGHAVICVHGKLARVQCRKCG